MNIHASIKEQLQDKEYLRSNNRLLWAVIVKEYCDENNITSIDELLQKIVLREIPDSHTLTAALSVVRQENPHLRPDEVGQELQRIAQMEYIQNWRNAI